MRRYDFLKASRKITGEPCLLHRIIITTIGGGPGIVRVFNSRGNIDEDKALDILAPSNVTLPIPMDGALFDKGLYVQIVEKSEYVTVVWEHLQDHDEQPTG